MTVIVTDAGFGPDDWTGGFATFGTANARGIDLPSDTAPETLDAVLEAPAVRIDFPNFADGRGFTLARLLRLNGYRGRLRASGHVLCEQYAMARRAGFDEVEISDDLAARQPQELWLSRAAWQAHDYQNRLRGSVAL